MRVRRVTVGPSRVIAEVVVDPAFPQRMDAATAGRLLTALPGLARHRCEQAEGLFVEELRGTEVAHAVEHVALELMVEAGASRGLRGVTSWDHARDGLGVYEIGLDYEDDVVCLAALGAAVELVRDAALGRVDGAGASRRVAQVREAREAG